MRRSAPAPTSPSLAASFATSCEDDLWFREFALAYTNIATIIEDGYVDAEDNDGIFSGFNATSASYMQDTWQYKGEVVPSAIAEHRASRTRAKGRAVRRMAEQPAADGPDAAASELRLPDHAAALRALYAGDGRTHHRLPAGDRSCASAKPSRTIPAANAPARSATPSAGRTTRPACRSSAPRRSSRVCSAISAGRAAACMALRGHCSIQGSTDIPTLYNMLPTYLPQPNAFNPHTTLEEFLATETRADRLVEQPAEIHRPPAEGLVWRPRAAKDNEFGYEFVPKLTGDHSQLPMTLAMVDGAVKGQFVLGQNPVVGAVNSELVRARHGQAGMAGGARLRDDRDGEFLAEGRHGAARRAVAAARSAPKSSSCPPRWRREGRHRDQHHAAGAVARQGL